MKDENTIQTLNGLKAFKFSTLDFTDIFIKDGFAWIRFKGLKAMWLRISAVWEVDRIKYFTYITYRLDSNDLFNNIEFKLSSTKILELMYYRNNKLPMLIKEILNNA